MPELLLVFEDDDCTLESFLTLHNNQMAIAVNNDDDNYVRIYDIDENNFYIISEENKSEIDSIDMYSLMDIWQSYSEIQRLKSINKFSFYIYI